MTRIFVPAVFVLSSTLHAVAQSTVYVMAGKEEPGEGSKANPFNTLAAVESFSVPGDTIYVIANGAHTLDGGIALKPDQKLIGVAHDGKLATTPDDAVRMTNTTPHLDGVIVRLSERNEVAGIHFVDMQNHAIHGAGTNYSGARIHHNWFTGAAERDELIVAVLLEAAWGNIQNVSVTDCDIRDGEDLAGIRVMHQGDSTGEYVFARNRFSDIGGRAYLVWSRGSSAIESRIEDSTAENIGRGDRNADSIDPRLWGRSQQNMYVRNYRYNNAKQVGNRSNTGFEAFIMGEPFRDPEEWCDGCELTLEIVDSVFENTITDGIQLTNYGSNSVLDFRIRNTKIIGANPQQAGGAVSLIAQNDRNSGSKVRLLVENCDIVNSSRYGFAILDRSGHADTTVDLGGGPLGSKGGNRVINSAQAEIRVLNANPVAKNNYWGGNAPRDELEGDSASAATDPSLAEDPRPE